MHRLYLESCQETGVESVSLSTYQYIFCNSFSLGFGTPKSDTCTVCDAGKSDANATYKKRAEQAFEAQKRDRQLAHSSDMIPS